MSDPCRNDCVKPVGFPGDIQNRPALAHIDYRIGTYADFRAALIRGLNQDPVLAPWTHRQPDDPGIALLEGAAILGDILTFYQELYANEAFPRTAQWRESIADLVRLTGYRLSPGLAGKATFAVEVKGDKPVTIPKGFRFKAQLEDRDKPAEFESSEEHSAYPHLSKFHLYRPRTNSDGIGADGTNNKLEILSANGAKDIASITAFEIKKGDRMLLMPDTPIYGIPDDGISTPHPYSQSAHPEIAIVADVETLLDRVILTFKGSLIEDRRGNVIAYRLGRSFRHFGNNAPINLTTFDNVNKETILTPTRYERQFGHADTHTTSGDQVYYSVLEATEMPLNGQLDDLGLGGRFVCQGAFLTYDHEYPFTIVKKIKSLRSDSLTWSNMAGPSTVVILDSLLPPDASLSNATCDIRKIAFHEVDGPELVLCSESTVSEGTIADRTLKFWGTYDEVSKIIGRNLFLQSNEGSSKIVTVTASKSDLDNSLRDRDSTNPWLWPVSMDAGLDAFRLEDFDERLPTVTVFGNLVEATQGKTETEAVLGSGDSRQTFQTLKLPKKPLTYFRSEEQDPPEAPELMVYVNDRLWQLVPSFFDRGPDEQVYIVRQDAAGDTWVQFGDGKNGARLPSGVDNVTAVYRTGTGATGPIKEGATAHAGKRLEGLRKVYLPGEAFGGSDRESGENAKAAAPGKLQSLGRLVTLQDIECEARALPGVIKAKARWDIHVGGAAVVVTLLTKSGPTLTERQELAAILNQANQDRGSRRFPIVVRRGVRHYIYLTVAIGYEATYKKALVEEAVKTALGVTGEEEGGIEADQGLFGIKRRCFGQPEYTTRIEGTIQQVEGVVWARVDRVGFLKGDSTNPAGMRQRKPLGSDAVFINDTKRPHQPSRVLLVLHQAHFNTVFSGVDPTQVGCHD